MPMPDFSLTTAVAMLLGLQFAAFGWRINREISVSDEGRKAWLPIADVLNIVSMLCVVGVCAVLPLATGRFNVFSRATLACALVLVAFHPITMCGHYRLFLAGGRHIYTQAGRDYPYVTAPEGISLFVQVVCASCAAVYVFWHRSGS